MCHDYKAKDAVVYPRGLCRAVLKGLTAQLEADGKLKDGCFGIQTPDEDEGATAASFGPHNGYSGKFKDDLTGQVR